MIPGKAYKFSDNVNTDDIIPAIYLDTVDEKELASHCMEGIDPNFSKNVQIGSIIVAGKNFGCGSSREHAPIAIKACGISAVVAVSFARIFFRNSINIGLPLFSCQEANEIKDGDTLKITEKEGIIENLTQNKIYKTPSFPEFILEIISSGGLMKYSRY
ncbi:MAG: 3-isopropylmalate dehydratase small subunit [Thermodesulfobacteriota bacterium]|nr:3-isopropylmalate dehydratase small subunit [Thermodesulfobacteriota bacterium]